MDLIRSRGGAGGGKCALARFGEENSSKMTREVVYEKGLPMEWRYMGPPLHSRFRMITVINPFHWGSWSTHARHFRMRGGNTNNPNTSDGLVGFVVVVVVVGVRHLQMIQSPNDV